MPCQVPYKTGGASQGQPSGSVPGYGMDSKQNGLWVPNGAPFCGAASGLVALNRGEVVRFVAPRSITITKIVFGVFTAATADDPCDVGIFNQDWSVLLGSAGPTAGKLNAQGQQTVNLLAAVPLVAGTIYYAAFACGTVGGTAAALIKTNVTTSGAAQLPAFFGVVPPMLEQGYNSSRYPLASGQSFVTGLGNAPIFALLP